MLSRLICTVVLTVGCALPATVGAADSNSPGQSEWSQWGTGFQPIDVENPRHNSLPQAKPEAPPALPVDDCTGRERLTVKCVKPNAKRRVTARLKRGAANTTVTFRLNNDPDTDKRVVVKDDRRATAVFKNGRPGKNVVSIVECDVEASADCPSCGPGTAWEAVDSPFGGSCDRKTGIYEMRTWDDGRGEALYAGGSFTHPGRSIARWDGAEWTSLGSGTKDCKNFIRALEVFDDGQGERLYASGFFTSIGGVDADGIAKWDGDSWAPLGEGFDGRPRDLVVFDRGQGPELITAGPVGVWSWNGKAWSSLEFPRERSTPVQAVVLDSGEGPDLYVTTNTQYDYIRRYDGGTWSELPLPNPGERAGNLAVYDDGGGARLYTTSEGSVHKWSGSRWNSIGGASGSLYVHDSGDGPALYLSGSFDSVNGVPALHVARWDGKAWSAVGIGIEGPFVNLATFDDGSGPALYAASAWEGLKHADCQPVRFMARFSCNAPVCEPCESVKDVIVKATNKRRRLYFITSKMKGGLSGAMYWHTLDGGKHQFGRSAKWVGLKGRRQVTVCLEPCHLCKDIDLP